MVEKTKSSSYIVIDAERCKGCRCCIVVCPVQIIGIAAGVNQIGANPVEILAGKADSCSGCGVCALMCPDAAISVFSTSEVL